VPNLDRVGTLSRGFHIGHLYYFTPATLSAALERAGFAVDPPGVQTDGEPQIADTRFGMRAVARIKYS
jgi:hypothetical protein